jgi:hypothetical protein
MSDGYRLANEAALALFDDPLPESSAQLFTAVVTAVSWPTVKIRPTRASTAGDQLVGICLGVFPVVNARVVCAWIGGEPVVLGTIAPVVAGMETREFDFPIQLFPDHFFVEGFGANTADTSSTTDTLNYVTNFDDGTTLPDNGTWRVWVFTWQLLSHSAEAGNVRWSTKINASSGGARNGPLNITTTRTDVMSWHTLGGLAGGAAVTYEAQYRPNTTGTATAGGGDGIAIAMRE